MAGAPTRPDLDWSCDQIAKYRELRPRHETYASVLGEVLSQIAGRLAPYAIVQTRPKAIASFAEKIQRKWPPVRDPINEFTDLCGGRVITFTQEEVRTVCQYLCDHFEIDWNNTVPVGQRLKTNEFGYRSEHYIVQFKKGVFPNRDVSVAIPGEVMGLKAEIQVRTLLEHAWAGFSRDRVYKGAFAVPAKWVRELAGIAAMLEQTDDAFCRIEGGLQTYGASYGAYMTDEQMRAEIELLENVLACDPGNPELAGRIGKLAMTLGDWEKAVDVLEEHVSSDHPAILRDLGVSLCKLHAKAPAGLEYQRGQQLLEQACNTPLPDPDALASLAGTWQDIDQGKARAYYRRAYEVAPTYPYAVGNFLRSEIAFSHDTSPITLMAPAITAAMQRCRDQIAVGMNLPWAYYDLGTFHLVLGRPYESLGAYAKAVQLSEADWVVETSLRALERLEVVRKDLVGYEWVRRLLLLALAARRGKDHYRPAIAEITSAGAAPLEPPVVILAGSCDASAQALMATHRPLLLDAFCGYAGALISGGTTAGIGGLAGDIQEAHQGIRTVGHVPELIPLHATPDRRYRELRTSPGHDFDPLGPLQMWADIVASGIEPGDVRLLGIGGGRIAAAEYRIALALGAQVGMLEGSGREAARLMGDPEWQGANPVRVAANLAAVRQFLGLPGAQGSGA